MTTTIVLSVLFGFQNGFIACWLYLNRRQRGSQREVRHQEADACLTWLAYELRLLGLMLGQLQDGQDEGDRGS